MGGLRPPFFYMSVLTDKNLATMADLIGRAGAPVTAGDIDKVSVVHKFGRNTAVGTSFEPVCFGGVYQTPQTGSATTLRIKAGGNANDIAGGSGARKILIIGLDETGAEVSEELATNGTAVSSATTTTFMRVYRAYVSESGTYATQSAGSHSGAIVVEDGSNDWFTIGATGFPKSQTEIGAYSVPLGYTAYITGYKYSVDSTKAASIILFQRQNILETAAPYTAMRSVHEVEGVTGYGRIVPETPFGKFPALTDIGFMASVSTGTASVSINFEIILIAD